MKVDCIFLANTANEHYYNLTMQAINSLLASETEFKFNPIVVETNPHTSHKYPAKIIIPNEEFNYNRFLNIGFKYSDTPYLIISNNDVIFHKHWFTEIYKAMQEHNLDSASPYNPGWFQHVNLDPNQVHEGYGTGSLFTGWNLVFKRESLNKILPLDERFLFWCADDHMQDCLKRVNSKHALVGKSIVQHLTNGSLGLVKDPDQMLAGMGEVLRIAREEDKNL